MTLLTRRTFLETSTTAAVATGLLRAQDAREAVLAGPASTRFAPVPLKGNSTLQELERASLSKTLNQSAPQAPRGSVVCWGIPFRIESVLLLKDAPVTEKLDSLKAQWLVFMHTTDREELEWNQEGFLSPTRGFGRLSERVADYVVVYADGSEEHLQIRRRHQVNMFRKPWGETCFEAVSQTKPYPVPSSAGSWGVAQTRTAGGENDAWLNWLWAWANPNPEKPIREIRFEPKAGALILSAISAGSASSHPLRWETRQKAILKLPGEQKFDYSRDRRGQLPQIQIDMGQVISAQRRRIYPNENWPDTENNRIPDFSQDEVHIEYSAHRDARVHFGDGSTVEVSQLMDGRASATLTPVNPAVRRVRLRVADKASGRVIPVRLHVHGESSEYLPPVDRHRYPNSRWFEDYCAEYQEAARHYSVYMPGETIIDLPLGKVYLEVSKGFEFRPIRRVFEVKPETEEINLQIEKVLDWRERGWVTADTHVHFLSPPTAQLEGSAEGVNIINLLASQWGELMTNVGDFDGKTTFGSREAGGDGEWLVRVGTENRQHVMGHISLLGYGGNIIAPMCSGGANEAALGDPIDVLLTEWAERCRDQGGIVVLPHFPEPRAENAMAIVEGKIDGIELCSLGRGSNGIDPYSLSDYYRYLNCGYYVPVVGGTDKMSAALAVGRVRTYARIPDGVEFTYESWKEVIRRGQTFVSWGPLMEFSVDGKPSGSRIRMKRAGGTVDVAWELASATVPMTRVDLVVNGEIRESRTIDPAEARGNWSVRLDRSSWIALLVRGRYYSDTLEMIAAHSSPVMVEVENSEFFSAADAVTILDQIEGSLAYLDTVGTHAQTEAYKRMRMRLTSAYRNLHNKLHQQGHYHEHTAATDHPPHH